MSEVWPANAKERAIFHVILAEMHRAQACVYNLQSLSDPDTEAGLREHFTREQTLALGRISEWRQRRPQIYRMAAVEFKARFGT